MTQLRSDPESISNWFDKVLEGIGHRGSSFSDIDKLAVAALTHDGFSHRFLFQEFKRPGELTCLGQWWMLYDLARQPNTTVWLVRQTEGLCAVEWLAFHEGMTQQFLRAETIDLPTYRQRYADWWNQQAEANPRHVYPRLIWAEYIKHDRSLQQFVEATLLREGLAVQTALDERDHWKRVAEQLFEKLHLAPVRSTRPLLLGMKKSR